MPRWDWLKTRNQILVNGALEMLQKDLAYCIEREEK